MVGKLIKHEIKSYLRTLLPVQAVLLGMGILTRFVQFFESDSTAYGISFWSSLILFIISIVASLLLTFIIGIVRFYKNLFTGEGYLSFTLPVTPGQQLFTKALVSFLFSVITIIVILISSIIAMGTDVSIEVLKAVGYLLGKLFEETGVANGLFYIIEVLLLILVAIICGYLLIYACISIGQLARKNKILAAVGVYFGYSVVLQIIGTLFVALIATGVFAPIFRIISDFIETYPLGSIHIGLILSILFIAVISFVYYLITYFIIKKHLNLE